MGVFDLLEKWHGFIQRSVETKTKITTLRYFFCILLWMGCVCARVVRVLVGGTKVSRALHTLSSLLPTQCTEITPTKVTLMSPNPGASSQFAGQLVVSPPLSCPVSSPSHSSSLPLS